MRRPGHPYLAGAPLLVAHRGGAKLAPENTMAAFRSALADWRADMLELDVHLSADGEVVVIHDPTVDRTTDGTGAVRSLPWAALAELDAGYRFASANDATPFRGRGVRIPRLEELLEEFPGPASTSSARRRDVAAPLVRLVQRHGAAHRVLVAAIPERNRAGRARLSRPLGRVARAGEPVSLFCASGTRRAPTSCSSRSPGAASPW
jgi:glycerophosphoryl diester phosphodiesterase